MVAAQLYLGPLLCSTSDHTDVLRRHSLRSPFGGFGAKEDTSFTQLVLVC